MTSTRRFAVIAGLVTASVIAGLPAMAAGPTVAIVGSQLLIVGTPGDQQDGVVLTETETAEGTVFLVGGPATPGDGCVPWNDGASCTDSLDTVNQAVIVLGAGEDGVTAFTYTRVSVRAGPDADEVKITGPGRTTIAGGGGDDLLTGGWHSDTILSGPGDDEVDPRGGADRVRAGGGDDEIYSNESRRDFLFGGPGFDSAHIDRDDVVRSVEEISKP